MYLSTSATPVSSESQRIIKDICATELTDVQEILRDYKGVLEIKSENHMGYPYNLDFDYTGMKDLDGFSINNLGDPFIESNYGVHSRCFEVAVLDWFAGLWDIERKDYWGYITACGTEGNLQGIYLGRENLPDGVLYSSEESHYSVFKAARMYRMDYEKVGCNVDGTIDIGELKKAIGKPGRVERPIIVNANIGTTMKGGVDDLDEIIRVLKESGREFYIHCDGALAGVMIGVMHGGEGYLSFAKKPIGSISVSGHKFIGSPVPCGIIVTRMEHIRALARDIDYINSRDATIMGSRNGHTPLYLWYALVKKGLVGIKDDVDLCIMNAAYLARIMTERGVENVMLNKWSCTVVFRAPDNIELIRKWQLACSGGICHIVVMPNIKREKMLEFLEEYLCVG